MYTRGSLGEEKPWHSYLVNDECTSITFSNSINAYIIEATIVLIKLFPLGCMKCTEWEMLPLFIKDP